jgi:glucose-6-phosphate isomerase
MIYWNYEDNNKEKHKLAIARRMDVLKVEDWYLDHPSMYVSYQKTVHSFEEWIDALEGESN